MKIKNTFIAAFAMVCASAFGQEPADRQTTVYQTPEGQLTVNSGQPASKQYGPPPPFAELDRRGTGFLGSEDAAAYPLLADDFIHADSNRDGRISRAEYQRWAKSR